MTDNLEDKQYLKRYNLKDVDQILTELHGAKYLAYRKEWNKTEERKGYVPRYPLDFFVELTSYCNLKCKMCINNFSNEKKVVFNLPMATVDELVKQCRQMEVPAIALGLNGECILHPEIKEILGKFNKIAMDLWVYTNGIALSEDLSAFLIDSRVERLLVSLDAATKETYKRIRGGNLDVVERNIRKFLELRREKKSSVPILRLSFVKTKENLDEINAFYEKWKAHADLIDFQDMIDCTHVNNPVPMTVKPFICSHPFQRLGMDWNGDLYPCCSFYYKYHKIGNIENMTLLEAWNSEKIKTLREAFLQGNIPVSCQNCYGNLSYSKHFVKNQSLPETS